MITAYKSRTRSPRQRSTLQCAGDGPRGPGRAAALAAQRCHPAHDRCAAPPGGDRRSRPLARDDRAAKCPMDHRLETGRLPGPPRAAASIDPARAGGPCAPEPSRPEYLHPPGLGDSDADQGQRRQGVNLVRGCALRGERCRVARTIQRAVSAVPRQLARKIRADR